MEHIAHSLHVPSPLWLLFLLVPRLLPLICFPSQCDKTGGAGCFFCIHHFWDGEDRGENERGHAEKKKEEKQAQGANIIQQRRYGESKMNHLWCSATSGEADRDGSKIHACLLATS